MSEERKSWRNRYVRFLGKEWRLPILIEFLIGIFLFILGIMIFLLFSPEVLDIVGMLISMVGILISLNSATRGDVDEVHRTLLRVEERLRAIEDLLKELIEEVHRLRRS